MAAEATGMQIAPAEQTAPRYRAFISYSHRDRTWGDWLHHSLETYRVPKSLINGAIPSRIFPVFRDREELAGATNLTEKITTALRESRNLVVICSPHSAESRWVNEEINYFIQLGRADRIFLLIVEGEPHAKNPAQECFPPALRFQSQPDAEGNNVPADYLAADARPIGDGKKNALLKLIAGILDVDYDKLKRRDHERQVRLRTIWISALALLVMGLSVLTGFAFWERGQARAQRDEATRQKGIAEGEKKKAETQRDLAEERQRIALSRQLAAQALNQMVLKPDLALLLAVEAQGSAKTFEANSSLLKILEHEPGVIMMLHGQSSAVTRLAFSPDGKTIASGGADGTVRLWSSEGQPLSSGPIYQHKFANSDDGEWHYLQDAVDKLVFSPDGAWLASRSLHGLVQVEDVRHKKAYGKEINYHALIQLFGFAPEGHRLILGCPELVDFDFATGQETGSQFLVGGTPVIRAGWEMAAIRADGKLVVPDGDHKHVRVFDPSSHLPIGNPFFIAQGWSESKTDGYPLPPQFTRDGKTMAIADGDGSIQVWDLEQGKAAGRFVVGADEAHGRPLAMAFSAEGNKLFWANDDGSIRALEQNRGWWSPARDVIFTDPITSAAFSADGAMAALGSSNGLIRLWDLRDSHQPFGQGIHTQDFLSAVAISPDGKSAAVSGDFVPNTPEFAFAPRNYAIDIWDLYTGEKLRSLKSGDVRRLAFSSDGRRLAASSTYDKVDLYEMAQGNLFPILLNGSRFDSIAITPDGNALELAGNLFHLWTIKKKSWRPEFSPIPAYSALSAISPNGSMLATTENNKQGKTYLLSLPTGMQIGKAMELGEHVSAMAFNPDNSLIAICGASKLQLWDVRTQQPVGTPIPISSNYIHRLAFSPDGQMLVAVSSEAPALLIDVQTKQPLGDPLPPLPNNQYVDAAFSSDGKLLVLISRSRDDSRPSGELYSLDMTPDAWIARACRIANRNLTEEEWIRYFGERPYRTTCPSFPSPSGSKQQTQ